LGKQLMVRRNRAKPIMGRDVAEQNRPVIERFIESVLDDRIT